MADPITKDDAMIVLHRRGLHWMHSPDQPWTEPTRREGWEGCPFCEAGHIHYINGPEQAEILQTEDFEPEQRAWIVRAVDPLGAISVSRRNRMFSDGAARVGWAGLVPQRAEEAARYARLIQIGAEIARELDAKDAVEAMARSGIPSSRTIFLDSEDKGEAGEEGA